MEDHILTDHSDIFRSASDSLDGSQIEESPKRIERKEKVKTSEDLESEIEIKFGWDETPANSPQTERCDVCQV